MVSEGGLRKLAARARKSNPHAPDLHAFVTGTVLPALLGAGSTQPQEQPEAATETGTSLALHAIEGEPCVLDTDLAERLGMPKPTMIRQNLIEPNRAELLGFGPLSCVSGKSRGQAFTAYYLNEEQATLVVMFSRTPKAAEAHREIIRVFTAYRRGELERAAPKPALPDFNNPALAARAWADAKEAEMLAIEARGAAEAKAKVLMAELEGMEGVVATVQAEKAAMAPKVEMHDAIMDASGGFTRTC